MVMENKEDQNIEKLVERMMMNSEIESPSPDFTQNVMSGIYASQKSREIMYKPIFSKRTWFIIFTGIIAIFIYSFFNSNTQAPVFEVNFSWFRLSQLEKLFPNFRISFLTAYVILLAASAVMVQIFLLKKYFDKQLES
jgi:hypothetical protein